jgi:hypothetical protein
LQYPVQRRRTPPSKLKRASHVLIPALKAPIRRSVNHGDAPKCVMRRFGTDLAQWKTRRPARANGAFLIGRKETFEMNAASLTPNALLKSAAVRRRPEARC